MAITAVMPHSVQSIRAPGPATSQYESPLPAKNWHQESHQQESQSANNLIDNFGLFVTPERHIELRPVPIKKPSPSQVMIHVKCTGICGSDLHLWHRGSIGPLVVTRDTILGHEASGVVVATGSEVTHLQRGDRVAIEPGVPCNSCFLCASGKYNLCESVAFSGTCPHAGTIQRLIVHDARYCHKMPPVMSFAQGALLEPLSVVLHAVSLCRGSLAIAQPALVCGAGPIGLIALAVAKASGAWPLVITDLDKSRLEFAQEFVPGAQTYLIDPRKSPLESAEEIRQVYGCGTRNVATGVHAPNEALAPATVLECTGVESSVITAIYSCVRSGTVMVIGVGRDIMNNLPFMHLSLAEIQLRFTNRYTNTWPVAINALSNSQVLNLDRLVTHTFPLHRAVEAMQTCDDRTQQSIKVQIVDEDDVLGRFNPTSC